MTRWVLIAGLGIGCIALRAPAPTRTVPGVGECPPGTLTNACREDEWKLLVSNPRAAANHLDALCDEGSGMSCLELGLLLGRWRNLPRDEPHALDAFSRGCMSHIALACSYEAMMLEAGRGSTRRLDRALDLHQRACALGIQTSCAARSRLAEFAEQPGELDEVPCAAPCKGGLEKSRILRVMKRRRGSIQYCYELALEHDARLTARVATVFKINNEGHVIESSVTGTSDEPLAACVAEALRDFQFPRPTGGGEVNVTFPFVFVPGGPPDGGP